jgi:hypothetical protein
MSSPTHPEVVRHHSRYRCAVPATIRVDESCAGRVAIAPAATDAQGRVAAEVVDRSDGGLGLHLRVFVPLRCLLRVSVSAPDGRGGVEVVELRARVQRVTMMSREPRYYVGVSFIDADDGTALARRFDGASGPAGVGDA